ncbi:MAG: hypothetical protein C4293_08765 [Nitrospiraceae bacterium]
MAKECAVEAFRRLIIEGVLNSGDCSDPNDLSLVADAVYKKRNKQEELVKRLPVQRFRNAEANEGYLICVS